MRLYVKYLAIHIKSLMQYKSSFLLTTLGQIVASFSAFVSIYFLFERFCMIADYSFSEVLLCFAVVTVAFALAECFARGFDVFPMMISNGEFDRVLVRPRNEIMQVLASKIELSRIGRLIQAAIIFAYAIPASGIRWSAGNTAVLALMIICGTAVFSGLFLLYAAICFFTLEGLEFMNILTDGGREFGRYPFSIYGREVLLFLTFVVPLALFQFYPFLYLTGRSESVWFALLPIASLLFLIPCVLFWRYGVRRYRSTGS